jgi:hypothetical protein
LQEKDISRIEKERGTGRCIDRNSSTVPAENKAFPLKKRLITTIKNNPTPSR